MNHFKTLFCIAGFMTCSAMSAQVNHKFLGERNAMVTLDAQKKYLLLPIQESAEMAHIRVIRDNRLTGTLNCRLAIDRVDYYVPYETGEGERFDIIFDGNFRTDGAIEGFTCWKKMTYSNTFDTANAERYRPLYHHTPLYGWMNDPNGMFYKDGVWHLYYQYNPYGSQWENMSWGHSTSTDLVHWTHQPVAIRPDGLGAIFSGSCVVDEENTAGYGANTIVAFYTTAGANQTQSMAYSTDGGQTFTKYSLNPIITSPARDFRDPKVFWNAEAGFWNMLLAVGQEMQIYSSTNLRDWTYESSFGKDYGCHGGVWECPDLVKLTVDGSGEEKWMLFCNINPGGPAGGSASQYFIGSFDGHTFQCESAPEVTKWMDYGKDHYATVTFANAPDNRCVAMAWMSNWQYAAQVPTRQFRSANSIARELGLFTYNGETYCSVKPVREMDAARGKAISAPNECCEMVVNLKGDAQITLSNHKGERVVMTYDGLHGTFDFDRRHSGNVSFSDAFPAVVSAPTYGKLQQLRIFIDKSSIEIFDAEGKMAMTNLVFPTESYTKVSVKGKAKIKTYKINK